MANTGLGSQLGFAKETTWGTAVTVTKFFRYENETFSLDRNYVDPVGLAAGVTFAPQFLTKATTRTAGGGFQLATPYRLTGHLLDQMVPGTITPVQQSSTVAYLSTFNVGSGGVPTKSGTIQINKPQSSSGDLAFTYPGAVLMSAQFSMATGGILMTTWNWIAKDETTPSTTPAGAALASASYAASDDVWSHVDTTLTYSGGAVAGITGVDLTWTQPYADSRFFLDGSGTRGKPIPNGIATVTGTLSGSGTTARSTPLSGLARSLRSCSRSPARPRSPRPFSRRSRSRSRRSRSAGRRRRSVARTSSTRASRSSPNTTAPTRR
jgi:hypothetical protein